MTHTHTWEQWTRCSESRSERTISDESITGCEIVVSLQLAFILLNATCHVQAMYTSVWPWHMVQSESDMIEYVSLSWPTICNVQTLTLCYMNGAHFHGYNRMPWCETLRKWVNWMLHWLGYLWPWPLTLNFQGQMGGPIVIEWKGHESIGCHDVEHSHCVTSRQRMLLGTGWLKMSCFRRLI